MTKMTLLLSIFVACAMVLSGCNKTSANNTAEAGAPVDTTLPPNPNLPPEKGSEQTTDSYYKQFLFKIQGDCSHPETVSIHSITNLQPVIIGKTAEGRDLAAFVILNLYAEGTYEGVYNEAAVVSSATGEVRYQTLFHTNLEGTWAAPLNQLTLSNLGVGGKFVDRNVNKILFKIQRRLNRPEIMNSMIPLELVQSTFGSCPR